jgi:hypothetical protein
MTNVAVCEAPGSSDTLRITMPIGLAGGGWPLAGFSSCAAPLELLIEMLSMAPSASVGASSASVIVPKSGCSKIDPCLRETSENSI